MMEHYIAILRDKNTRQEQFCWAAHQVAHGLAQEIMTALPYTEKKITTPLAETRVSYISSKVMLIPILRSGVAFLPIFQQYFPEAGVGFMGLERDEATAKALPYYKKFPSITSHDHIIVLDPMIATGGSAMATLQEIVNIGIKEEHIHFAALIAAASGLKKVKETFAKVSFTVAVVDDQLNDEYFIVPGLGDFGDRYFGTEKGGGMV